MPLAGIRVLDLSRVLAGPWATQLLGDYGADVVKVERPTVGDDTRHWGPPWLGDDHNNAAYFLAANRNKRSLTVDLTTAAGQDLVGRLAATADVFVENFRNGVAERMGLGHETLRVKNPRLVYCSISAYGRDSSRADEPGYDAMIQASAGLMSITGEPEETGGMPQKVGVAVADIMAGMYAASAILAALHGRAASGSGQYIEVPLYDSQVAWLANQNMNYLIGGAVPPRRGNAHPNIVPYQAFATSDGYLMLAVGNDLQFRACMQAMNCAELGADQRFTSNALRVEHRDELVARLAALFVGQATQYWLERLGAAGVPCGPINTLEQVFSSDYSRERPFVRHQRHRLDDELPTVANPVRFSATAVSYKTPPPLLGEHCDEVLADWLGYSPANIQKLRDQGAI
jgi:formyl-CoA transferase